MKQIGIIGAGIMASGMARNFLKHGYVVHLWNHTAERMRPLVADGAIAGDSPRAVAEAADIVIECVRDDEASRSVWLGKQGILAGASKEKVLLACSSLSLDWTDELARTTQENGLPFLDAPLTGSRAGAEGGTLKLLVGGERQVLDGIRPDLGIISDKIYHFGSAGAGMRFKLILNTLSAIQIDSAAQALNLDKKAGLHIQDVRHALFDAPMGPASGAVDMFFKGLEDPVRLNFSVKLIEKDLRYAKSMAEQYGLDFKLLNQTQTDYEHAKSSGLADRDWTAIAELYDQEDKPKKGDPT